MKKHDIRWIQRFSNYNKSLAKLTEAIEISNERNLTELEAEGLIQRFEYVYELAWNVLKDYLEYQGITNLTGPRDAIETAFAKRVISDGEVWMDMIKSRQKTSHTYSQSAAEAIQEKIIDAYFPQFLKMQQTLESIRTGIQKNLY